MNNGRLVHNSGTSVIGRNLQVMQASGTLASVSNAATPRTVATWANPVASTTANVLFSQAIQNTDVLVSGAYAKTLRFVLTTTTP